MKELPIPHVTASVQYFIEIITRRFTLTLSQSLLLPPKTTKFQRLTPSLRSGVSQKSPEKKRKRGVAKKLLAGP